MGLYRLRTTMDCYIDVGFEQRRPFLVGVIGFRLLGAWILVFLVRAGQVVCGARARTLRIA